MDTTEPRAESLDDPIPTTKNLSSLIKVFRKGGDDCSQILNSHILSTPLALCLKVDFSFKRYFFYWLNPHLVTQEISDLELD